MTTITILGAGVMGSALTIPLTDNGHAVRLVGTHLDTDIIEEIHQSRTHPKLKRRIPESVQPYPVAGLEEALHGADLLVLGVSSPGVGWAAQTLSPLLPAELPVVMLTKGLGVSDGCIVTLPELLRRSLPEEKRAALRITAIGGPSFARELASRRHTGVVLAGDDPALLKQLQAWLQTAYYHVWTSSDLIGVEACVALKNAYALGMGIVEGWLVREGRNAPASPQPGERAGMFNPAGMVFAQGLLETATLVQFLGGRLESVYTLPGAGDFYATCHGGRNYKLGRFIGGGRTYRQAMAEEMPGDTVEGAELILEIGPALERMVEKGELDFGRLPLMRCLWRILAQEAPAELPWGEFFAGID
jgi:glycerol-3-phosphate dehydrogenase (NAD(P)+)